MSLTLFRAELGHYANNAKPVRELDSESVESIFNQSNSLGRTFPHFKERIDLHGITY